MTAAKNVTATFNASTYTLIVTKLGTGNGTVTSSVAGITCGTDCMENYVTGTSVTLTAAAATGSTFTGWSGVCTGTGACSVSMTAAKSVTATFTTPAPDFVITGITLIPASSTFNAKVTVKNQGTLGKEGGYLDVWGNQPAKQTCGAMGNASVAVGNLNAGQSKTFTLRGLRNGNAGVKTFRAFIDSQCGTWESRENNNQRIKSYRVQ